MGPGRVTTPANSTTNRDGAREYTWPPNSDQPERFPSVTTLLKDGVPKTALQYWVGTQCANFVLDNYELVGQARQGTNGRKVAYDMIRNAPWNTRDTAADMGTILHDYAEHRAMGLNRLQALDALQLLPETAAAFAGFQQHWELWYDEWKPEFERTEFTVFNRRYGYAGTGDGLACFRGYGLTLFDYKSTKPGRQGHGIYPETALQLNAYAHGEFIGLRNGTEAEMPEVRSLLAVNIRHNGYHVIQAELSERAFRAFLYASQVARFVKEGAGFLSAPLAPPIQEVATA